PSLLGTAQETKKRPASNLKPAGAAACPRAGMGWLCLILLVAAGCGGGGPSNTSSNGTFSISPGTTNIDTNCTGCNATDSGGNPIEQFKATLSNGSPATVNWTISPQTGNIDQTTGRYTPPGYLTSDSVTVKVTAALASNPN